MGKRKRDRSKIRRKIRRLEQKLRDSSTSQDEEEYDRYYVRSPTPESLRQSSHSDAEYDIQIRSDVVVPTSPRQQHAVDPINTAGTSDLLAQDPGPSSKEDLIVVSEVLPPEILEALGDPIGKEEVLGPPINEEISKRWGRILVEGLTKEVKEASLKKTLTPENFTLSKAPKLNLELSAVVSDTSRYRDKLLERSQNQLGLGIAGLINLASSLIKEDHPKVEILKKLSEVSQIFLDLHYENTQHRRKLITSSLDKKFTTTITDVKRDSFLFGANLGERIRATKTAEKSGLQIKRSNVSVPSTSRQQGNWRGPPRYQPTRAPKPGGPKPRFTPRQEHSTQQGRRLPAANRAPPARRSDYRTRKNQ